MSRKEIASVVTKKSQEAGVWGQKVSLPSGSHSDWMSAAGISPESDYGYVNFIFAERVNERRPGMGNMLGSVRRNINKLSQICPNWQK